MRGSRKKALTKDHIERYGTAPAKAVWTPVVGGYEVKNSAARLYKKLYRQWRKEHGN